MTAFQVDGVSGELKASQHIFPFKVGVFLQDIFGRVATGGRMAALRGLIF
jgi:hypothetical protein